MDSEKKIEEIGAYLGRYNKKTTLLKLKVPSNS